MIMSSIVWTQTEKNLMKAFLWESKARAKYDLFAKQAKKEWLEQISAIFNETALNEVQHGKRFFRFLEWGDVEINASFVSDQVWDTLANLKSAAFDENEEWEVFYPSAADTAIEEWFPQIAQAFRKIAEVEKAHEERFKKLYQNLEDWNVFKSDDKIIWKCRNCGYLHEWVSAPEMCPACLHPQSYFQIKENNY